MGNHRLERKNGTAASFNGTNIQIIGRSLECRIRVKTGKAPCEHMFSALPLRADIAQRSRHVRFVPKGDVTPVYSITPSTVASNLEGSFRPNVLAVLSRRFSLSVPYWLPWTIVHLQRGGADDEDDFGTNPK